MALLPGDGVEHGGHHKEPTKAKSVDPGGDGLPVVVGQEVEVGAAEDAGNDPELKAERGWVLQRGDGCCRARLGRGEQGGTQSLSFPKHTPTLSSRLALSNRTSNPGRKVLDQHHPAWEPLGP